ncbi:MAG TPA: DUF3568 family protein [Planctomycetota bacterium]
MKTFTLPGLLLLTSCAVMDDPGYVEPEQTFPRKAEEVAAAAVGAVQDLDLAIVAHDFDSRGGRLDARRADGDTVRVELRSVAPDRTTVSIRVAPENEGLPGLIFDRISSRLGRPATP